jgi:hypothetical protein
VSVLGSKGIHQEMIYLFAIRLASNFVIGSENQVLWLMSEFLKSSAELHSKVQTGHSGSVKDQKLSNCSVPYIMNESSSVSPSISDGDYLQSI